MIPSIPPLFILAIASSKDGEYEMDVLAHASIFGMIISVLNTDAKETPGISYVRDLYHCSSTPMGQGTLIHKLTQNLGGTHWEGVGISHPPQFETVKPFGLSDMSNT